MRLFWSAPLLALLLPTLAHAAGTGSTAIDLERLKAELKEELREELRLELKEDLGADKAAGGAAGGDAWAEEEWKWEEPVKPELNFLEMDGYFRFRYDLFNNLDLGTYYYNAQTRTESGPFAGTSPPVPLCATDYPGDKTYTPQGSTQSIQGEGCASRAGVGNTLGGANMRLRLEPTFNVYEDIKIKMQLDVLDNLVLGSTPDGFPQNPISPLLAFSQTQISPVAGLNAVWTDSIRVKRVWAEVMTPLGQLRVGRMPSQFGMGILANEGNGLDNDFGDTNDRIMFATKVGDFYIIPAFDWVASGVTSAQRQDPYGQPFDRDQRDDVDQYILAIVKRDKPEEIKQKLENDEYVLNYGTYQVGRFQALDAANFFGQDKADPNQQAGPNELLERDVQLYAYSYWVKFLWRKLSIEAEYAGILGRIGNPALSGPYGATDPDFPDGLGISQHGATLNVQYKLLKDALTIQLLVVAASGDSAPGWGIRPLLSGVGSAGQWDGSQAPQGDRRITNFRFDPDFIVDMIFWRQLVGNVTDALVIRPGVQYNLTEAFGARFDLVYSRAWFASSTPSGSFTEIRNSEGNDDSLGNPDNNLGLEGDFKIFYDSEDGFHAWFQYGMFIPFGGLDRQVQVETYYPGATKTLSTGEQVARLDSSLAHTLQLFFGVSF
jgi:uncharacterized protein (TIGR04551 family)